MTFQEWYYKVDILFIVNFGLGVEDMPDYYWAELYEDGFTPEEAYELYYELYEEGKIY